jgi:hypothetical protein
VRACSKHSRRMRTDQIAIRYADRRQPISMVRRFLVFVCLWCAEDAKVLMNDSHHLFVPDLRIEHDAIPTRWNCATLCDFGVCHLGERDVFAAARYKSADPIRIRTNKNRIDALQGCLPSVLRWA